MAGGPYELEWGRERAAGALRCDLAEVTVVHTEPGSAVFAGCGRQVRLLQHCEFDDVGCSWFSESDMHEAAARWHRSEDEHRREATSASPTPPTP